MQLYNLNCQFKKKRLLSITFILIVFASVFFVPSKSSKNLWAEENSQENKSSEGSDSSKDISTSFLLLKGNYIQEGIVSLEEEQIIVQTDTVRMNFKKDAVLYWGKTREELWNFRKQSLIPGDPNDALQLANWAARNKMESQAVSLLMSVLQNEKTDQKARQILAERVEQILLEEKVRKSAEAERLKILSRSEKNGTDISNPSIIEASNLTTSEKIQSEPTGSQTADSANSSSNFLSEKPALLSKRKAEEVKIPLAVQDHFSKQVQPILLDRCLGCHSPESTSVFVLTPLPKGRTKLTTEKNMQTIFDWVNFQNSKQSRILNHPPLTSAGKPAYIFGNDKTGQEESQIFLLFIGSLSEKMKGYRCPSGYVNGISPQQYLPVNGTDQETSSDYSKAQKTENAQYSRYSSNNKSNNEYQNTEPINPIIGSDVRSNERGYSAETETNRFPLSGNNSSDNSLSAYPNNFSDQNVPAVSDPLGIGRNHPNSSNLTDGIQSDDFFQGTNNPKKILDRQFGQKSNDPYDPSEFNQKYHSSQK